MHAFAHHFAKLAGGARCALAGNGDAFDGQKLAADFGPGKAGDRANLVFLVRNPVPVFAHPGIVAKI